MSDIKMKGIDISNWQSDLNVNAVADSIDFCIMKATEGIGFTDGSFSRFVSECENSGLLYGFYHFARENNPASEALFFYNRIIKYLGHGLPVLDYETENTDDRSWVENFCSSFHELSGLYPVIYTAASWLYKFNGSWITEKCPLWLAGYPHPNSAFTYEEMPYNTAPWDSAIMWQFSSDVFVKGYMGRLDANYSYITADEWVSLSKGSKRKDNDMHCFIRLDERDYMVYYDGVEIHPLGHPDELEAVQKVARQTVGHDLPVFDLGTKDTPWGQRFVDAVTRSM